MFGDIMLVIIAITLGTIGCRLEGMHDVLNAILRNLRGK